MSIAVSTVVKPSRLLFFLVGGMSLILLFVAGLLAFDSIGNLSITSRLVLAAMCVAAALYAFFRTVSGQEIYAIDISGAGQIRVAVHKKHVSDNTFVAAETAELMQLLPVSTLWSNLLFLHLQNEQKKIVLPILPDSVSQHGFKALLVACRWIAVRRTDADDQRKA
jgi:toxin CptA